MHYQHYSHYSTEEIKELFYDDYDAHNQYYIDRANFCSFYISQTRRNEPRSYTPIEDREPLHYKAVLLKLANDGGFLQDIAAENINLKMCAIALCENVNIIKFVPKELLGELYVYFDVRHGDSKNKKRDGLVIDAVLREMDANGLKNKMDFSISSKRRKMLRLSHYFDEDEQREEDKNNFKVITDKKSVFYNMSYAEVLNTLEHDGLLLGAIPRELKNNKMCQIAMKSNPASKKYITREFKYKTDGYPHNFNNRTWRSVYSL